MIFNKNVAFAFLSLATYFAMAEEANSEVRSAESVRFSLNMNQI
jgi:hypothetical protein